MKLDQQGFSDPYFATYQPSLGERVKVDKSLPDCPYITGEIVTVDAEFLSYLERDMVDCMPAAPFQPVALTLAVPLSSKEARGRVVTDFIAAIHEGEIDPLKAHIQVKEMEDVIARLTDKKKYPATAIAYAESVLAAAQAYGSKSFDFQNAKCEIKETGTSYDYSMCEDPELALLSAKKAAIDEAVKQRQAFLQTVPARGLVITDQDSGETVTVYPPAKKSTTSVTISLK